MKKIFSLILCFAFMLSLTACGRTANNVVSDTESMAESVKNGAGNAADKVTSGGEDVVDKATDKAESAVDDAESSTELMAGITASDAKESALRHAGLDKAQVTDVEIDLDRDNGSLVYEVNFKSGDTEYDYEINAQTGDVISANKK